MTNLTDKLFENAARKLAKHICCCSTKEQHARDAKLLMAFAERVIAAERERAAKAERMLDWCKMRLREPYRDLFDKYRKHPPEHDQDAPPLVISECDSARKEPTP